MLATLFRQIVSSFVEARNHCTAAFLGLKYRPEGHLWLLLVLLPVLLSGCKHTLAFREACADGRILEYENQPVGCIYDADAAFGRVEQLCSSDQGHTNYESITFGVGLSERFGGGRSGCLVCIHRGNDDANSAIQPGGLYPDGFEPGIGCLGYFRFQPVETLSCVEAEELAGPDVTSCCGGAQLGSPALAGYRYQWAPAEGLSCTDCARPTASIALPAVDRPSTRTVVYTLTATCPTGVQTEGQVRFTAVSPSCC